MINQSRLIFGLFILLSSTAAQNCVAEDSLFQPMSPLSAIPDGLNQVSWGLISAGPVHTCALTTDGLYCFGYNGLGQLGIGNTRNQQIPVKVHGILAEKKILQVSAGGSHTCALTSDGLYCFGHNGFGQLGIGNTQNQQIPVKVHGILAEKKILQVSAGGSHTCALTTDGLYCFGYNVNGQLGIGNTQNQQIPVKVQGVLAEKKILQVSAGGYHTCALTTDGLYCFGYNVNGQLGVGNTQNQQIPVKVQGVLAEKKILQVSTGDSHTCALTTDALYCFGANGHGQLGIGYTQNQQIPVKVHGVLAEKKFLQVSAGGYHTCALTTDGLYCSGANSKGQLGIGNTQNQQIPVKVQGVLAEKKILQVSTGDSHTCALTTDALYCFGDNVFGELGIGNTRSKSTPVKVRGVTIGKTESSSTIYLPQRDRISQKATPQVEELIQFINAPGRDAVRERLLELGSQHGLILEDLRQWHKFECLISLSGTRKVKFRIFPQMVLAQEVDLESDQRIHFLRSSPAINPKIEIPRVGDIRLLWDEDQGKESTAKLPLTLFRLVESKYKKDVLLGLFHVNTIGISMKSIQETQELALNPELILLQNLLDKEVRFMVTDDPLTKTASLNFRESLTGSLDPENHLARFGNSKKIFGLYSQNISVVKTETDAFKGYQVQYGSNYSKKAETLLQRDSSEIIGSYRYPVQDIYLTVSGLSLGKDMSEWDAQLIVDLGDQNLLITSYSILKAMTETTKPVKHVNPALFDLSQRGKSLKTYWRQLKNRLTLEKSKAAEREEEDLILP
jgi:alpha-tubulin suppressor-like RCC1 family protein